MGKKKKRKMLFWTKANFLKFAEAMMDKPLSCYAFEMLYDVDGNGRMSTVTKSCLSKAV